MNKGLRLDYFLVSRALAKGTSQAVQLQLTAEQGVEPDCTLWSLQATLDDCRILDGYGGSDHCPIVCSLRMSSS